MRIGTWGRCECQEGGGSSLGCLSGPGPGPQIETAMNKQQTPVLRELVVLWWDGLCSPEQAVVVVTSAMGSGRERRTHGCNTREAISDLDGSSFAEELRMKLLSEFSCLAGP